MTWNLWWRFGPWQRRREAILSVLRETRPDVVGLQEVWTADGENFAEQLAAELGMEWAWAEAGVPPYWPQNADASLGVGNAVLSRWPILESGTRPLPTGRGPEEGRVALYALINAPDVTLPFFTTHLHAAPFGSAVRCAQVRELAGFIADQRDSGTYQPVVGGDFNAEADSDELRLFGGIKTEPVVPGLAMVDLWRYAARDQPWATWSAANPYIVHPGDVDSRIDYLHVALHQLGARRPFGVRSIRVAGDAAANGVWPSDHLAVVADLITEERG